MFFSFEKNSKPWTLLLIYTCILNVVYKILVKKLAPIGALLFIMILITEHINTQ